MQMAQNGLVKVVGGYTTLDANTANIAITHNLGVVPNFAAIWVDTDDYDIIPFGSCVVVVYQKYNYDTDTSAAGTEDYAFGYSYKHDTSGNLLKGISALALSSFPTSSVFNFARGARDWKALDVNGNPLRYRWVIGYMPMQE